MLLTAWKRTERDGLNIYYYLAFFRAILKDYYIILIFIFTIYREKLL